VSRPYPGARTSFEGVPLVVWRARAAAAAPEVYGAPGQIVRLPELGTPAIVTGEGLLLVEEVEGPDGFDLAALAACHQRRLDVGAPR
jgi:methionyl-tRNA formyltransferase